MWRGPLAIPLSRDGSARFLPWLIALMVYLAGLALAGAMAVDRALTAWDLSLAGTFTVELPADPAGTHGEEARLQAAVAVLRQAPGIARAEPLDQRAVAKLVEPWLGTTVTPAELPLPQLIDVRTTTGARPDLEALKSRLAAVAPGAILDDHRRALDRLAELALSAEAVAIVVVALIAAAAVLTIVFTTRTGLVIHRDVIELLHLMGARDGYIARQFESEALKLGLLGGVIGLALAGVTVLALSHAAIGGRASLFPTLALAPWQWALILGLLPAAALVAAATARLTVLGALARLP